MCGTRMIRTWTLATLTTMAAAAFWLPPATANPPGTYRVTISNLTSGQPLTPALVATHKGSDGFFRVGDPASFGLKEIAENGNLTPMVDRISDDDDFFAHAVVTGDTGVPPVMPGETVSFEIGAAPPFNFLSWASMLICTNDGFTGVDAVKLPSEIDRAVTVHTQGYDTGTEVNTERFADIVPPCGPLTGVDNQGLGTGVSDPALAEGGVIHHHGGIIGVDTGDPADPTLDPDVHDWDNPVASLVVERVG